MKCPYCAEEIQAAAIKCRYCGEWLTNDHPSVGSPKVTELVLSEVGGSKTEVIQGGSEMPKSVRIILEYEGVLRKLFRMSAGGDGSIYLFPYGPSGRYFCGQQEFEEQELQVTFPFDSDPPVEQIPKISLHPSGQVHVKAPDYVAGPLHIPNFDDLRGHHVASVSADALGSLTEFTASLSTEGEHVDHVQTIRTDVHSARVVIYVNGRERAFPEDTKAIWPLEVEDKHVEVGLAFLAQEPLGERGVSVIAGWNPLLGPTAEDRFLFVRGE